MLTPLSSSSAPAAFVGSCIPTPSKVSLRLSYRPAQDAGDLPDAGWGGEKKAHTRDPVSTRLDPNDPKSKQTYVPPAESFEEYMKRRQNQASGKARSPVFSIPASNYVAPSGVIETKTIGRSQTTTYGKPAQDAGDLPDAGWGGEKKAHTRDPVSTHLDRNDPKSKQTYVPPATSFEEYMKKRMAGESNTSPTSKQEAALSPYEEYLQKKRAAEQQTSSSSAAPSGGRISYSTTGGYTPGARSASPAPAASASYSAAPSYAPQSSAAPSRGVSYSTTGGYTPGARSAPASAPAASYAPQYNEPAGKPAQDAGDLPDAGWGGEKKAHTRDPVSTRIDPNDPKSKQTYVPPAMSFEEYMKARQGGSAAAPAPAAAAPAPAPAPSFSSYQASLQQQTGNRISYSTSGYTPSRSSSYSSAPVMAGKPAQDAGDLPDAGWGGEKKAHTRDPVSTRLDPNDPKSKQTYIPPAESFEEYLKRRQAAGK